MEGFARNITPDYEEFLRVLRRQGTPGRIHHIELFHDPEIHQAITRRFEIDRRVDPNDPDFHHKMNIEWMRFMGYDYVCCGIGGPGLILPALRHADDTTEGLHREGGRRWANESEGVIASWEDFEKYPWPDPCIHDTAAMEWYEKNLPDDMTIVGMGALGSWTEWLFWLFGYERLCFAIFEQPDLVNAVLDKIEAMYVEKTRAFLQFSRVSALWGSDDLGFRSGLLLGTPGTREFILPRHRKIVRMIHEAGRLYLLHSCGNLADIMDDLIDDVRIDAKHSFEDTIEDIRDTKRSVGERVALLGGVDVDFLCRGDEASIRRRVREIAEVCMPGGGWCLGTGNSVANYIPLDNYLAMVDEGRKFQL